MATDDSFAFAELQRSMPLHRRWGWLFFLGIVQLVSGGLALLVPVAASLAAAIIFGAVLFTSGTFQIVHAFSVGKKWTGVALQALGGLLYVAAGVLALLFPLTGALTLTLIVGALLVADGVVRSMLASQIGPQEGRWSFLAAGVASAIVGILLLVGWPLTGVWAIGILLGVNLIFSGVANCALAIAFRSRVARAAEHAPLAPA